MGLNAPLMSEKSMIQPRFGSRGPLTWTSMLKLCPCRRPHLCPGGTWGNWCAASIVNTLKISIWFPKEFPTSCGFAFRAAGWRGPFWARSDELVPVPEIRVEERIRDGADVVAVIRIGNRSIVPIAGEHGGGDGGHQPVLILEAGPGERRAVGRNQRIALDSPRAAE